MMSAIDKVLAGNDSPLTAIFSYLPNSYRFVAPVCRSFQRNYLEAHGGNTNTTWANGLQTPSTAQIWLQEARTAIHNQRFTCDIAAKHGTLQVLQFLRSEGYNNWSPMASKAMAERGDLEMLKWARQNGCPWNEGTCYAAAENGHLEVLKWARLNGCPWNRSTCNAAAENGHLEVLKWARLNGCPWNADTCSAAAYNGHLEVLIWARQNGCPWHERTCHAAAEHGHLEVLKWARANGCEWDADWIIRFAINQDVLTWVRENR